MPILDDLIENMVLVDEDHERMRKRGFTDAVIEAKRWRSCHPNNARIISELLDQYGAEVLAQVQLLVPDKKNSGEWTPNPQLLHPNVLITYCDSQGKVLKVRPHKLGFKGEAALVYRPTSSFQRSLLCVIAESEFKADAAEVYGYSAIGIPGISTMSGKNWNYFFGEISSIKTEEFVICFDNEIKNDRRYKNFKAKWQDRYETITYAYAMCQKIINAGFRCRIATLPAAWMLDGKIDIDGALAQKRPLHEFKAVIDNSLLPREYFDSAPIHPEHISYVNRKIRKFFFFNNIEVINNCYHAVTMETSETGEKVKNTRRLTNCVVKIQNVYEELGGENKGIRRDFVITDEYGISSKPVPTLAISMATRGAFTAWLMAQGNYLFYGKDPDMTQIWEHVFSNDDGNTIFMIDRCGYIDEYNFYLFKNVLILLNSNATIHEVVHADASGVFWVNEIGYKPNTISNDDEIPAFNFDAPFDLKKFTEYLGDTTDLTSPGLAKALIGWVFAVIFINKIVQKFHLFPLLFLHGNRGSGKTTIMRWLTSFFGLSGSTKSLAASSPVGITRLLSYYSSLPLVVDDWRDDQLSKKFVTLFLGVYNRQVGAKGIKAKFGLQQTDIRAALAMMGEEMITDNGLATRCVSFYIPMERRHERLAEIEDFIRNASSFTYDIYQNYDKYPIVDKIQDAIITLKEKIPNLEQRLAINYGILLGAYNAVIGEADQELLTYFIEKSKDGQREVTMGDKLHKFAEEFMFGVAENIVQPHHYKFNDGGKTVILWIKGISDVMNKFYNRSVDSSSILLKHLTQQPYFVRGLRVAFKGLAGKYPGVELNLEKMPETMRHYYEGAYRDENLYV